MSVKAGDAFSVPSGPEGNHLFVVVLPFTNFFGMQKQTTILVSICSIVPKHDRTCELLPGDHPFITRPSYVAYSKARAYSEVDIQKHIASGFFSPKTAISAELLVRIKNGLIASPRTQNYLKDLLHGVSD